MNDAVHWYFGTQQAYLGLKTNNKLDPNGMYFITDTNEFYYKDVNYMNNTIYFTGDLPDIDYITPDHLYFNTTTLTAYMHDGTNWNVIVEPARVSVLITPEDDTTNGVPQMVTGAAVKAYVDRYVNTNNNPALVDISWDNVNSQIRFKRYIDRANLDPTALYINQFAASIRRDAATGNIWILASDGTTKLSQINIKLDNYVVSGLYDNNEKAVVFTMSNGQDVKIYAQSIVKIYNRLNTSSVTTQVRSIDGLNYIEMAVNISPTTGNELYLATKANGLVAYNPRAGQTGSSTTQINTDDQEGLYVNREHLIDYVRPLDFNTILKLDQKGYAATTSRKIGSANLSSTDALRQQTQTTEQGLKNTETTVLNNLANTYARLDSFANQYSGFAAAYTVTQL